MHLSLFLYSLADQTDDERAGKKRRVAISHFVLSCQNWSRERACADQWRRLFGVIRKREGEEEKRSDPIGHFLSSLAVLSWFTSQRLEFCFLFRLLKISIVHDHHYYSLCCINYCATKRTKLSFQIVRLTHGCPIAKMIAKYVERWEFLWTF